MPLALQAVVSLNPSSFNKGMSSIQRNVSNATGAIALSFGGATGEILAMSRAFGVLGGAVATVKALVQAGVPFEQAMANVASVTGLAAEEMARLEVAARNVAKETKFTATEAATALYSLGSAGISTANNLISTLTPSLLLAGATLSETQLATETLTATMIAMKIPFENAITVADLFAGAIAKSPLTMERLAEGMKFAAPAAAAFGLSLEDTTKELAAFNAAGVRGGEAGTAFRRVIIELAKQVKKGGNEVSSALRKWDAGTEGLTGAVRRLEKAGISTDEVVTLLGKRAGPNLALLMKLGADSIDDLGKAIMRAADVTRMYEIQLATLGSSWRLFISQIQETALLLFDKLGPALDSIVKKMTNLAREVNAALVALGRGDITIWEFLQKGLERVGDWISKNAFKVLIGALILAIGGAPVLFAAKMGALIGIIANMDWAVAWEGLVTGAEAVLQKLPFMFDDFMSWLIKTVFKQNPDFMTIWDRLEVALLGTLKFMTGHFLRWFGFLKDLVKPGIDAAIQFILNTDWFGVWRDVWVKIGQAWAWGIMLVGGFLIDLVKATDDGSTKLKKFMVGAAKFIFKAWDLYMKLMWLAFDGFMAGLIGEQRWTRFKNAVVKVVTGIVRFWMDVWKRMKKRYTDFMDFINHVGKWRAFKMMVAGIWLAVKGLAVKAMMAIGNAFNKMMGKLVGEARWDKVKNIAGKVFGAVANFAVAAWNKIKAGFAKMMAFLKDTGLWEGFKSVASNAWDGLKDIAEKTWEAIKKIWKAGIDFLKDPALWKSVGDAAAKVWGGIKKGIELVFEGSKILIGKIKDLLMGMVKAMTDAFKALFGLIGGGIGGGGDGGGIGGVVPIDTQGMSGLAQEATLAEILGLIKGAKGILWQ